MSALPNPQGCPDFCHGNVAPVDPGLASPSEPADSAQPALKEQPDAKGETGSRSRRQRDSDDGSTSAAAPRVEAAGAARGKEPDYKGIIMARPGFANMPQALPISLGAPLDVIVSACAETAKIAPSTAALVIATMASAAMGRASVTHGLGTSERTAAAGLSLSLVTGSLAGAGADLAVQIALQVEAKDDPDGAGAGSQADSDAFREMVAACTARGYDVVPAKSAKATKPAPRTLVLENATLRGLERVWPGIGAGLLVVSRDSMPTLPPKVGPVGAILGHLDGLQLSNSVKIGGKTRYCSVAVIGAVSPDGLDGARLQNGAYGGVISRLLWAPCDGARRTLDPPSDLVVAMTRLRASAPDDGTVREFCLNGDAARRFRRVADIWTKDAQEKMPPLRQAYVGAAEMTLRIAAALHAFSAAVSNKPIDSLISIDTVYAAISLVRASLALADSVLGPMSVTTEIHKARAVVGWLRGAKGADAQFTLGEVERALSGAVTPLEVKNALKVLHETGLIEREEQVSSGRYFYVAVPGLFD